MACQVTGLPELPKLPQYSPAKEVQVGRAWQKGLAGVYHGTFNTGLRLRPLVFTGIRSHCFHPDFLWDSPVIDFYSFIY